MHYANGRPAANGDKVMQIMNRQVLIGVLYDAVPGNDYCNGTISPIPGGQHVYACLADAVHLDDVLSALNIDLKKDLRPQLAKVPKAV
jgi:hypothetical protein